MERRGIAVVVINEETGKIETSATFDTHISKDASTSLKDFILSNKNDSILVFMVRDEGSQQYPFFFFFFFFFFFISLIFLNNK